MRKWRQVAAANPKRVGTPSDQHHDHHRRELHDAEGLPAGFGNAFEILPPEIERDGNGESGSGAVDVQLELNMRKCKKLVDDAHEILPGGDATDWTCKNIVEHQSRNGKFSRDCRLELP